MDIKTIKDEINFINDAINEEIEMILKHKGRIPRIELDMIMSNLREIYEYFYKLQELNNNLITKPLSPIEIPEEKKKPKFKEKAEPEQIKLNHPVEVKPKPEIKTDEIIKQEEVKTVEIIKQEEVKTVELKIETEPEKTEEKIVEVIQQSDEKVFEPPLQPKEKPIEVIPQPEDKSIITKSDIKPEKSKTPEQKKSTLDLFAETSNTIGDKFLEKNDISIAANMSHNQIINIKKAIGINEKFLFINELFHGNMHDYNLALDKFNSYETVYEAGHFIDELKSKNNWKTDENPFNQFVDIIKRKYTK